MMPIIAGISTLAILIDEENKIFLKFCCFFSLKVAFALKFI